MRQAKLFWSLVLRNEFTFEAELTMMKDVTARRCEDSVGWNKQVRANDTVYVHDVWFQEQQKWMNWIEIQCWEQNKNYLVEMMTFALIEPRKPFSYFDR